MRIKAWGRAAALLAVLALAACAGENRQAPAAKAGLLLKSADFAALPGWTEDDQTQALKAFAKSCARISRISPATRFSGMAWAGTTADWQAACARLPDPQAATPVQARQYFETSFLLQAATADGDPEGLFTGYYAASLKGSRTRSGPYQIPLRARPADLVMVNLGEFRDELKGQRIAGRVKDGQLTPYDDRAAIEDNRLPPAQDRALVWVDNAVDAFFLQIQGSGVVTLDDGASLQVGYDGQNGYPYYAIGKELVKRGHLTQDQVSMQSIRAWLTQNPVEGREVMRTNRSYVFFKILDKDGAVGAEGLPLTAGRSLAVDHALIPYGLPVFISTDTPHLQRLLVAQDTGGAITGPVRGDVFWGYGPQAEAQAGPMKARGQAWLLLPRAAAPQGR